MQSLYGGYSDVQDGPCQQVDSALILALDKATVAFSWGRDNLLEGLYAESISEPSIAAEDVAIDGGRQWLPFIGQQIVAGYASWFTSKTGLPRCLWSIRLRFESTRSIVVALGELDENDRPKYHPGSLVVLFDDSLAREYIVSDDSGNAWGEIPL